MIDYHIHTSFSSDSEQDLLEVCKTAIKNGLKYIAITDHIDIDDSIPKDKWIIEDIHGKKGYIKSIQEAQRLYPELCITLGLETGYTPSGYEETLKMVDDIKPDFAIGSIHFMEGHDLYDKDYYENKDKKSAFGKYLDMVNDSIEPLSKYANVIGHIGFISKSPNIPYEDVLLKYDEFKSLIDEILKNIITHNMGIEINTSGLLSNAKTSLPDFDIVKRFKELGGEILTVGSDAHKLQNIGQNINKAFYMAKSAGFDYITIYENGNPRFIKI